MLPTRLEHEVIDEFRSAVHMSEGEAYFPLDTARLLVDRCRDRGLPILGVEAFELVEGRQLRPRVELIADFSAVVDSTLSWERKVRQTTVDALAFIDSILVAAPDLLVTFILAPSELTKSRRDQG